MNLSDSEDPEEHELLYSEFGRDNIQSNNFGTKTKTEIDLYNPITLIPGSNDKIEDNQNDCNDIVSIDSSPNPSPRNSIDDLTDHEENDDVDEDDSDCKNSIILPDLLPGKIYTSDEVYFNDADGSVEPPDLPEEEYEEVMNESNGSLLPNKNYYLLSFNWYKKWKNFTKCNGIDYDRPEPIDNSSLLTSFSPKANMYILNRDDDITKYEEEELYKLKSHISERSDYIILTEESWHLLYGWYGGGPSISRLSYQEKGYRDSRLDFYGYSMTILRSDNEDELVISVRKAVTVEEFLIGLINEWNIEIDELNNQSGDLADLIKLSDVRLWDYFNKSRYALLSNSSTLDDANITEDQEMMVEFIQDDGTWQWEESRISSSNNYSSNNYSSYDPYSSYSTSYTNYNDENVVTLKRQPPMKGLVGLTNLGNTCFMNSIIQCLSASTPLREVFSSKAYIADLNVDNPLGHKGKVAEGFASLMDVMYQDVEDGGGSVVAPRAFKRVIGDIAPQFQGYDQHDSQELLNFLLDGLHEDLNRVLVKESTNSVEGGDRTDEEVAAESLLVYKKRNDSIIADLCSGQFKSTVVCPDCHLKSRTFDAYFSISLPLAKESATEMMMSIKLITLSGKKMMYSISLPRVGPVAVIKVKVAEAYAESLLKSSSKSKSKLKSKVFGFMGSQCIHVWEEKTSPIHLVVPSSSSSSTSSHERTLFYELSHSHSHNTQTNHQTCKDTSSSNQRCFIGTKDGLSCIQLEHSNNNNHKIFYTNNSGNTNDIGNDIVTSIKSNQLNPHLFSATWDEGMLKLYDLRSQMKNTPQTQTQPQSHPQSYQQSYPYRSTPISSFSSSSSTKSSSISSTFVQKGLFDHIYIGDHTIACGGLGGILHVYDDRMLNKQPIYLQLDPFIQDIYELASVPPPSTPLPRPLSSSSLNHHNNGHIYSQHDQYESLVVGGSDLLCFGSKGFTLWNYENTSGCLLFRDVQLYPHLRRKPFKNTSSSSSSS
mmetsp:Transcript_40390/g.51993  ORF Transcript_40390/g.51993 Transcript_40390/m.51993 type:complete len:992 (+) Transcript_40390:113-3088(+)